TQTGRTLQLSVDILGRGAIRSDIEDTFWVTYTNSGDVDAYTAYVYLEIPATIKYRLGQAQVLDANPTGSPLLITVSGLAAGETKATRLTLQAPSAVSSFTLRSAITDNLRTFFGR